MDSGAMAFLAVAETLQLFHGNAAFIALLVGVSVPVYLYFQPFGQGIDAGHADAVQAA